MKKVIGYRIGILCTIVMTFALVFTGCVTEKKEQNNQIRLSITGEAGGDTNYYFIYSPSSNVLALKSSNNVDLSQNIDEYIELDYEKSQKIEGLINDFCKKDFKSTRTNIQDGINVDIVVGENDYRKYEYNLSWYPDSSDDVVKNMIDTFIQYAPTEVVDYQYHLGKQKQELKKIGDTDVWYWD